MFADKRIITEDLLIVCWKILKDSCSDFSFNYLKIQPISKLWFRKASSLISRGCFSYNDDKYIVFNAKSKLFSQIKFRIIELAFFFLLKSLFENKFNKNTCTLAEYLRLYIKSCRY